MLYQLLMKNICPIIVYQENEETIKNYIKNCKDTNVDKLLWAKLNSYQDQIDIGIKSSSMNLHFKGFTCEDNLKQMFYCGRKFTIPKEVINWKSQFAVICYYKKKVINKIIWSDFRKRINFPLLINDPKFGDLKRFNIF
jgi:hypothetical protein